ncbi:MAG: substrate-binding domain-containing protein [Clostridiaceae bacterium]|nr:substrate-binding domain-containing protein [Clostridiaceae bacterium]
MKSRSRKSIVVFILVLSLIVSVIGLTGCSKGESQTGEQPQQTEEKTKDNITIGLSYLGPNSSWAVSWLKTFKEEVAKQGIDCVILDANADPVLQDQHMEQLIQKKVDCIICWPVDSTTVGTKIKAAYDAGIPVLDPESIVADELLPYVVYVGYDTRMSGTHSVEFLNEALNGQGTVVAVNGQKGYAVAEQKSLHDEDLQKYPGLKVLQQEWTDWSREDAQSKMENLLTRYPDVDAVVAGDDNLMQGCLNAIKNRGLVPGKDIICVSGAYFGCGYDALKNGEVYGCTLIPPTDEARQVVDVAIKMALGEQKTPDKIMIPIIKLTKENLDNVPGYDLKNADW